MEANHPSQIKGKINADEVCIGKGVIVEEGVLITGKEGSAKKVVLGDFCYIGRETKIIAPEFRLGDYSKLHSFSFCHGFTTKSIAPDLIASTATFIPP